MNGLSSGSDLTLLLAAAAAAGLFAGVLTGYFLFGHKNMRREQMDGAEDQRLAEAYLSTIRSLVVAIDAKDSYTRAHTARVQETAVAIAKQMGLSASETEGIRTAALVHDIGKVGVPEHILRKPGRLTPEEFASMQEHPIIGSQMLEPIDFPWPIMAMVRSHHERWDGSGYPDRLRGKDIPVGARILAVADVFDALTSNRSYRDRLSPQEAVSYIVKHAGRHFDPAVVKAFSACMKRLETAQPEFVSGTSTEEPKLHEAETRITAVEQPETRRELPSIWDIARALNTAANPQELFNTLAEKMRDATGADSCVVMLREDSSSVNLFSCAASGLNSHFFKGGRTRLDEGVTGTVAATGRAYVGKYEKNDIVLQASIEEWTELRSCMVAPISRIGSPFGCINVYKSEADSFTQRDLSILVESASQLAPIIERAAMRIRVEMSTGTDPLTGLMNGPSLVKTLQTKLSGNGESHLSILNIGLDNFKSINERLGYHAGDQLLQAVARILRNQLNGDCLIARSGGDTFSVALPRFSHDQAQQLARDIEQQFEVYCQSGRLPKECAIGMSIGTAASPQDGASIEGLLTCACERRRAQREHKKAEAKLVA